MANSKYYKLMNKPHEQGTSEMPKLGRLIQLIFVCDVFRHLHNLGHTVKVLLGRKQPKLKLSESSCAVVIAGVIRGPKTIIIGRRDSTPQMISRTTTSLFKLFLFP